MPSPKRSQITAIHTERERVLTLASNLVIPVDEVIGQSIACFGLPGAGKTNAGALLAEQFAQYFVPLVIFDVEGDYASCTDVFPRGVRATFQNCPSGYDILNNGLQVVYDLQSWPNNDMAASVIISVVSQLTEWANARPSAERVPCLIFLDEASFWLPQGKGEAMSEATYKSLKDTFHQVAERGRKRGLTPTYFCPRISELSKSVLTPGVFILMKQTVDVDLNRYLNYVQSSDLTSQQLKSRIARFGRGKAIVKLPDGAQRLVQFNLRESEHTSHTPSSQAAIDRYAALPFNPSATYAPFIDGEQGQQDVTPVVEDVAKPVKRVKKPATHKMTTYAGKPTFTSQVAALVKKHPDWTQKQIAEELGCVPSVISRYLSGGRRSASRKPATREQ